MEVSGTPDSTGMTVASAAEAFERMLTPEDEGHSDAENVAEEETPQAEAEDEPDEGAEAEAESDDEDEVADPTPETPVLVTVKIDGVEQQVTLDEVVKGYQREADYTRKTMDLAEQRKALAGEVQSFSAERERTKNLLTQLEQNLAQPVYTDQQLQWLRENDPANFAVAVAENMQREQQQRAAQAERQRLEAASRAQREQANQAILQSEAAKLQAAVPEWKDEKVAEADRTIMFDYAASRGFSADEVNSMVDHRMAVVLRDAAKYRALQAKAPEVKAKANTVKTAAPGVKTQAPSKVTDVTRAKQRLAKTGRVSDAADVFLRMLPN